MNGAGHQFFASSAFPADEHRRIALCHLSEKLGDPRIARLSPIRASAPTSARSRRVFSPQRIEL